MKQIEVMAKGIRISNEYTNKFFKIDNTLEELHTCQKAYTVQNKEVAVNGDYAVAEIKDFRHKINSILDQLEKKAIDTEKKQTHELTTQLQSYVDECVTLQKLLKDRRQMLSATSNDNEAFIQGEKVSQIVTRAQLHVQKMMTREGHITCFKGNTHIIKMLTDQENFGETFLTGYYAPFVGRKEEYTVRMADDTKVCVINALCELDNGYIALTDCNNNRLKLLDAIFGIVFSFDLPCAPNDVCRIHNNTIIVALDNNTLLLFKVLGAEFKLSRKLKFAFNCFSVACHEDRLYIAANTDLYTSSVKGHNRKTINKTTLVPGSVNHCKVSNDGGHIYITGNNEILIADISSHSFVRIDQNPGMKDLRGMHITESGKMLVCDQGRNSVFIVEGKRLSSFIDSKYCPPMPRALCYTRHNPCLIIGHQDRDTITVLWLYLSL